MRSLLILLLSLFCVQVQATNNILGTAEDAQKLIEEDRKWQKAIDDFAAGSLDEVLGPYMQLINRLRQHPEQNACTDNILGLVDQALQLNPSSLVAYSMLYSCATKQHQTELKAEYLASINGIIRNLVGGRVADSLSTVIDIRELTEAPLLLQAMGYTVLDIEMVLKFGNLFYRYHVMDPLASTVTVRYFSNLAFMKRTLSNPNVSNDTAAQLLAQYYEQQKMDFALTAKAKRMIARKQFQKALEILNSIEEYSMTKNVLLAQIFLETEQPNALKEIKRELAFDSKSGFLDASVMLGAINLYQQTEHYQDTIDELLNTVDQYSQPGEGAYRLAMVLKLSNAGELKKDSKTYLQRAVEHNHPKATFALAQLYRGEDQSQINEAQAMDLLQRAKEYGIDEAAIEIALYLHKGSQNVQVNHDKELNILKQLAAKDNATALFLLAQRYERGIDVEADPAKALDYYKKAYHQGDAKSANQVGIMLESGEVDGKNDDEQAFQWYQKAADLGDSNGFANVARFYHSGIGRPVDLSKAANNYIRAAENGSYRAYCKLADTMLEMESKDSEKWADTLSRAESLYLYGVKFDKQYCARSLGTFYQELVGDSEKATAWFETAVNNGDNKAIDKLEVIYFNDYVNQDYTKALDTLRKGAQMGMGNAAYFVGNMYHLGQGTERDDLEAMDYFKRAARLGNKKAEKAIVQLMLQGQDSVQDKEKAIQLLDQQAGTSLQASVAIAEWFFYGNGFDKDYELARRYYEKAAEQDFGNAINHLGEIYRFGWGVEKDYDQAKRWYLKGVKAGDPFCAHNLGEMYYLGEGVNQDYLLAFEWFQKSAARNISHSQYYIAKMFQKGLGVEQDVKQANRLFYKAMDGRHQGAKYEIGKHMIEGIGMNANPGRGLLLITEAAEAGNEEAKAYLQNRQSKTK